MTMARRTVSDTLNVTLMDSGDVTQISGYTRESVQFVLDQYVHIGFRVIDQPRESGTMWTASCRRPAVPNDEVQVEQIGHRVFVRSRSLESVRAKMAELGDSGAQPEGEVFKVGPYYTGVLLDASGSVPPNS